MPPRRKRTNTFDSDDDEPNSTDTTSSTRSGSEVSEPPSKRSKAETAIEKFNARHGTHEKTHEEVLVKQMVEWSSACYQHFKSPPDVIEEDGVVKYVFVCKTNPSQKLKRARHDTSTGNLDRHVKKCAPCAAANGQSIVAFAHGSTYTKARLRFLLLRWIVRCHRPYAIVEDDELLEIFKLLNANVEVPSARTISRDIQEVFELSKKNLASMLQRYPGKLHIGLDGWTSPNVISFLGLVIYMVHDGKMLSFILDFVKLHKSHTGMYLCEELTKCLKDFGIHKKILGVVCDNASNNDTLVSQLALELDAQNGVHTRIRCFAHILNLVVKAILHPFCRGVADDDGEGADTSEVIERDAEDEDEDNTEDDDQESEAEREESDESIVEEIVQGFNIEYALSAAQIAVGKSAISKLKKLATRVRHSSLLLADLAKCCDGCKIESKKMEKDVSTRWNSLTKVISRALYLRPALEKFVELPHHNTSRSAKLKRFKLRTEEWEILTQLEAILQHFLLATERISRANIPLVHEVIPYMDALTRMLDDAIDDFTLHVLVRAAAARGRSVLNKYYSRTDESIMYRLAMLLHPRYKARYFNSEGWEQEWIDTATKLLREQWEKYYKDAEDDNMGPRARPIVARGSNSKDIFTNIDNWGSNSVNTELDDYIQEPPLLSNASADPIAYWSRLHGDRLMRMATDFLSAPATSVDVERAFSRGTLTISKYRHSLSDQSVRAAVVLKSWSSMSGIVVESDIVRLFESKSKRPKATSTDLSQTSDIIEIE